MSDTNELQIVEVQGVHGYIDARGVAWLSAEDVARKLGFVQVHKERVTTCGDSVTTCGENYYSAVRWDRVNKYLREFDYPTEVGKGDFLPEYMVYLLAMKANNDVAKKFQWQIAAEILPAIRKYGYYVSDAKSLDNHIRDTLSVYGLCLYLQGELEIEILSIKKAIAILQWLVANNPNLQDNINTCLISLHSALERFKWLHNAIGILKK